jgi:hypothetical protein
VAPLTASSTPPRSNRFSVSSKDPRFLVSPMEFLMVAVDYSAFPVLGQFSQALSIRIHVSDMDSCSQLDVPRQANRSVFCACFGILHSENAQTISTWGASVHVHLQLALLAVPDAKCSLRCGPCILDHGFHPSFGRLRHLGN